MRKTYELVQNRFGYVSVNFKNDNIELCNSGIRSLWDFPSAKRIWITVSTKEYRGSYGLIGRNHPWDDARLCYYLDLRNLLGRISVSHPTVAVDKLLSMDFKKRKRLYISLRYEE